MIFFYSSPHSILWLLNQPKWIASIYNKITLYIVCDLIRNCREKKQIEMKTDTLSDQQQTCRAINSNWRKKKTREMHLVAFQLWPVFIDHRIQSNEFFSRWMKNHTGKIDVTDLLKRNCAKCWSRRRRKIEVSKLDQIKWKSIFFYESHLGLSEWKGKKVSLHGFESTLSVSLCVCVCIDCNLNIERPCRTSTTMIISVNEEMIILLHQINECFYNKSWFIISISYGKESKSIYTSHKQM